MGSIIHLKTLPRSKADGEEEECPQREREEEFGKDVSNDGQVSLQ